jgi:hypothetical protein
MATKKETSGTLKAFLIELVVYAALVITYFFLVLHLLGGWLQDLSAHHRYAYAGTAILLIIAQALFLEALTTFLLRVLHGRSE